MLNWLYTHNRHVVLLVWIQSVAVPFLETGRELLKNLKEVISPEIFKMFCLAYQEKNSSFGFTFHYRVTERWFNCRFQFFMDSKDIFFNYNREVSKIDYKLYNILSVLICLLWSYLQNYLSYFILKYTSFLLSLA